MNPDPPRDCPRCPRLVAFRETLRAREPGWWNAPVPGWGDPDAWLLIVGLAPGLRGANRTARPFTGDASGAFLFPALARAGLARGAYAGHADDGLELQGAFIANAAACVPPQNRPVAAELAACRPFLAARIAALPRLRVLFALGAIAHEAVLRILGLPLAAHRFAHGAVHPLPGGMALVDSFHCSRQNTNTGRLTAQMFDEALARAVRLGHPD